MTIRLDNDIFSGMRSDIVVAAENGQRNLNSDVLRAEVSKIPSFIHRPILVMTFKSVARRAVYQPLGNGDWVTLFQKHKDHADEYTRRWPREQSGNAKRCDRGDQESLELLPASLTAALPEKALAT
jgi:hypothetical protein